MAQILVAEHDAPARRFLRLALEAGDHRVIEAARGDEAIRALSSQPVDAVITDYRLPLATGIDVIRFARGMDRELPCLILAGRSDTDVALRAMAVGDVAVVPKPASVGQVLDCVARAVEPRTRLSEPDRRRTTTCRSSGWTGTLG
jgi:two-component system, OmpR family, KDP operon response regulator KdpE